jgi:hypothetical protein
MCINLRSVENDEGRVRVRGILEDNFKNVLMIQMSPSLPKHSSVIYDSEKG